METFNVKAGKTTSRIQPHFSDKKSTWSAHLQRLALTCCLAILTHIPAKGQNTATLPLTDFFHGSNFAGFSGDTMKFEFVLGSEDVPVENVRGFNVQVTFPALTANAASVETKVGGSWVAKGSTDLMATSTYVPNTKALTFDYLRSDGLSKTGDGRAARLYLIRSGGFADAEAVIKIDGGLVVVENFDLRMGVFPSGATTGANADAAVQAFLDAEADEAMAEGLFVRSADGAAQLLEVNVANPDGAVLRLCTVAGIVVHQQACVATQQIDLSGLAAGLYVLSVEAPGRWISQKIIVR